MIRGFWLHSHEHYEELCALAASGQLTAEEEESLQQHLRGCRDCRCLASDFAQTSARLYVAGARKSVSSVPDGMTQRFIARARGQGITISPTLVPPRKAPLRSWKLATGAAAVVALLVVILRFADHGVSRHQAQSESQLTAPATSATFLPGTTGATVSPENSEAAKALAAEVELLNRRLNSARQAADASRQEKQELTAQLANIQEENQSLHAENDQQHAKAAQMVAQIASLNARITANDAAAIAEENELRNLHRALQDKDAALQQERHLLGMGNQVRDLVVARNLHIIDVYDNDGDGNRQRPFGRIFYTEGKSLIFYAYDLADPRKLDRQISFYAWGGKLGVDKPVKRLGIFHSEDVDGRWVLTFDDPAVLAQINSVFVTVESDNGIITRPNGKKILFAFLGNKANHP